MIFTCDPFLCDLCGAAAFSIRPGQDAEYAIARNLLGQEDRRLGSVMIAREVADVVRCLECAKKR